MKTPGEDLIKLEKRLMAVEMFLGIDPATQDLIHQKAFRQAVKSKEDHAAQDRLRDELHKYVYSCYDQGSQASLTAIVLAPVAIILNPESTEAERTAAGMQLAQLVRVVMPAWNWVLQKVLVHYVEVSDQITANGGIYIEPNFSQFNDSDPEASLRLLVKGA
ncbi:MAG: hypothetical protein WC600_17235 [Desulfobaccales bacterium]